MKLVAKQSRNNAIAGFSDSDILLYQSLDLCCVIFYHCRAFGVRKLNKNGGNTKSAAIRGLVNYLTATSCSVNSNDAYLR
jgi:hypothetical protein